MTIPRVELAHGIEAVDDIEVPAGGPRKMVYVYALIFLFTGVLHLVRPETFVKVIPPIFPYPFAIAIASGLVELAFAAGFAMKRTRVLTAWCVIVFLIAILPVHVYMYLERKTIFKEFPTWALMARFPLQALLIAWAHRYTRPPPLEV